MYMLHTGFHNRPTSHMCEAGVQTTTRRHVFVTRFLLLNRLWLPDSVFDRLYFCILGYAVTHMCHMV